jgi:hypothetical protein
VRRDDAVICRLLSVRRHWIFDVVRIWRPANQKIGFRTIRPYVMNAMRRHNSMFIVYPTASARA